MVTTIQLAPTTSTDFGVGIKIAPLTDETVTNSKTCFWVNGTQAAPCKTDFIFFRNLSLLFYLFIFLKKKCPSNPSFLTQPTLL